MMRAYHRKHRSSRCGQELGQHHQTVATMRRAGGGLTARWRHLMTTATGQGANDPRRKPSLVGIYGEGDKARGHGIRMSCGRDAAAGTPCAASADRRRGTNVSPLGPRHGVCKNPRPKGHKAHKCCGYYMENRDAEFEQKMAEESVWFIARGPVLKKRAKTEETRQAWE